MPDPQVDRETNTGVYTDAGRFRTRPTTAKVVSGYEAWVAKLEAELKEARDEIRRLKLDFAWAQRKLQKERNRNGR